jgi:autotransporter translocation and assembly factor TamB
VKRGLLTGLSLLALCTAVALGWLFTSEAGLRWSYGQVESLLPGELGVQQLSGTLNDGVTLQGLEYNDEDISVTADRVVLHWNPWALLWVRIDVSRLEVEQLELQLRRNDDDSSGQTGAASLPQLDIPLALQLHELEIDRLRLNQGNYPLTLEQLKLQASSRGSHVDITAFSGRLVELVIDDNRIGDFEVSLAGDVDVSGNYPHLLNIDWQAHLPSGEVIDNSTRIDGDLESTRLIHQSRGPLQAKLTLALQELPGQLIWQAELEVTDFDTRLLDTALPPAHANLSLSAKGDLHTAQASGQLEADTAELGPVRASFALRSLDQPRLTDGLRVDSLQLAILDGELAAQGQLYWSPQLSWDSKLSADAINPAALLPEWPGSLGGSLRSQGRIEDGKLFTSASIRDISGRLRGYPLSLRGEAHWSDDRLDIESARLESGDTRIVANGRVAGDLDLDWSLDSRNLAELYPTAQGQLSASGHLGGEPAAPVIKALFKGKSLRLDDYAIASIDGDIVLDLLNWRQLDVRFAAREVELQEQRFHSIDVDADQRRVKATLSADNANAEIELDGKLHDHGWRGNLTKANIDSKDFGDWRLRKPTALNLSRNALSSERICLHSSKQAEICSSLQQHDEAWNIDLDLSRVPLQMLRRWIPTELELDGVITATADLQYEPGKSLLGKLKADFPAAIARYPLAPENPQNFEYRQGELDLRLESGQIKLGTRLVLENGDWLAGTAVLPQADILQLDLERQTMQASVNIEARNWVVIDALIPQVDILHGEMEMKIDASGPVTRPELQFNGKLGGGAIHLLEPDVKIEQIEVKLHSSGPERLEYSADATAASGRIAVRGTTQLNRDRVWPNKLAFDVEGLDMAQLLAPWITPTLSIGGSLQANGELEIDIDDQGNVSQPRLQLSGNLSRGAIHLIEPELKIEEIELKLQSSGAQQLEFRARATAATGTIAIQGNTLLDWNKGWPSTLALNGENIDIASLLAPWIVPPLVIEGKMQASGEFSYHAPDQLLGELRLSSARGRLEYPLLEQAVEEWEYRDALLALVLDEKGINARSNIDIGDNNDIVAQIALPRAKLLALDYENQPLQASARVSFEELNLIQLLVPEVDRIEGELTLDLAVTGSLARPGISAQAEIPLASFEIPRLGLQIKELSLRGESDASDRFNFSLSAVSGDGHLSIHGDSHLDSTNRWSANLQVKGSDFEVSRIPEAQVTVSPDLTISIETRKIEIEGDLLVPRANLQPKDISTATRVSNDSVIIGGEDSREQRWQVSTRVNLVLGEQVSLVGFGFEGNFGGRLLIEDRPGELSTGSGEITILDGRYRAYGQRLEINQGRLLFAGGALDNPGLDVRAQRQINDVTVGLSVHGRLQQPEFELFSIPAMGETDKLSYLLFGHPMEGSTNSEGATMASAALALGLASGDYLASSLGDKFGLDDVYFESDDTGDQASLVVGRYLSPKMYVSYGVGLVESINSLTLRYQLADRWHLEAESGLSQGVDLLFMIER